MSKNTVVLIHGVTDRPGRLAFMARYLKKRGWNVLLPALTPSIGNAPIEELAQKLCQYINQHTDPNARLDIVGFSMGGLIARYYLQFLGGASRTDHLITISTPHQGTRITYLFPGQGMKQMRPNSPFLQTLNSDLSSLSAISCTSIYTPLDFVILPASSSIFHHTAAHSPCFRIIRLFIPSHPLMIYHPKVFKIISQILSTPSKPD